MAADFYMAKRTGYDELKEFRGKRYTGMRVGRSHKWRYDAGEWKERKVTPDRWEFTDSVVKRRAGHAPEGSGAPVGTAYHWYIVADQVVTKIDANSYTTVMTGHNLKIAHQRAGRSSWSASERAKNKQLVKLLRELADDLESRPIEAAPDVEAGPERASHRRTTTPAAPPQHNPRGRLSSAYAAIAHDAQHAAVRDQSEVPIEHSSPSGFSPRLRSSGIPHSKRSGPGGDRDQARETS